MKWKDIIRNPNSSELSNIMRNYVEGWIKRPYDLWDAVYKSWAAAMYANRENEQYEVILDQWLNMIMKSFEEAEVFEDRPAYKKMILEHYNRFKNKDFRYRV